MINRDVHFRIKDVKVDKDELYEILIQNRDNHIKEYDLAYKEFLNSVKDKLGRISVDIEDFIDRGSDKILPNIPTEDWLNDIREKLNGLRVPLEPTSYEKDYDKAIRMVLLCQDKTITLDDRQFDQLVLDEWDWKANFSTTTAMYTNGK